MAQVFSCEFCEILRGLFFQNTYRQLLLSTTKNIIIFSEAERKRAISEWPLFRQVAKTQLSTKKVLFEIYIDILREARANMKNIVVLLNVMVVILADTVAVEQGF